MEKQIIHKDLASGRWFTFSLVIQLANIGSDVERVIRWKNRGDHAGSINALRCALELLDLSIADPKNKAKLTMLERMRVLLVDQYSGNNQYGFTDEFWQQYFLAYALIAAHERGRW